MENQKFQARNEKAFCKFKEELYSIKAFIYYYIDNISRVKEAKFFIQSSIYKLQSSLLAFERIHVRYTGI